MLIHRISSRMWVNQPTPPRQLPVSVMIIAVVFVLVLSCSSISLIQTVAGLDGAVAIAEVEWDRPMEVFVYDIWGTRLTSTSSICALLSARAATREEIQAAIEDGAVWKACTEMDCSGPGGHHSKAYCFGNKPDETTAVIGKTVSKSNGRVRPFAPGRWYQKEFTGDCSKEPTNIHCLRATWKSVGCTKRGSRYPSGSPLNEWNSPKSQEEILAAMKAVADSDAEQCRGPSEAFWYFAEGSGLSSEAVCALVNTRLATRAELQSAAEDGASWNSCAAIDTHQSLMPWKGHVQSVGCGPAHSSSICFGVKPDEKALVPGTPGHRGRIRPFAPGRWFQREFTGDCTREPTNLHCLRSAWKSVGCTTHGSRYPTGSHKSEWNSPKSQEEILAAMKLIAASDVDGGTGGGECYGIREVFGMGSIAYNTRAEAERGCASYGARLATYDQLATARQHGADWAHWCWLADDHDGMSFAYPTTKHVRIPKVIEHVTRGGANCYGVKPKESEVKKNSVAMHPFSETNKIWFDPQCASQPTSKTCLQLAWKLVGCSSRGSRYPTGSPNSEWNSPKSQAEILAAMKSIADTNIEQCRGIGPSEVFFYARNNDDYAFGSQKSAQEGCESIGATLATKAQLLDAYHQGAYWRGLGALADYRKPAVMLYPASPPFRTLSSIYYHCPKHLKGLCWADGNDRTRQGWSGANCYGVKPDEGVTLGVAPFSPKRWFAPNCSKEPTDIYCLRQMWKEVGCTKRGSRYPTGSPLNEWNSPKSQAEILAAMKAIADTDPDQCRGPLEVFYYDVWGSGLSTKEVCALADARLATRAELQAAADDGASWNSCAEDDTRQSIQPWKGKLRTAGCGPAQNSAICYGRKPPFEKSPDFGCGRTKGARGRSGRLRYFTIPSQPGSPGRWYQREWAPDCITEPTSLSCLREAWKSVGCSARGSRFPTDSPSNEWKRPQWRSDILAAMKLIAANDVEGGTGVGECRGPDEAFHYWIRGSLSVEAACASLGTRLATRAELESAAEDGAGAPWTGCGTLDDKRTMAYPKAGRVFTDCEHGRVSGGGYASAICFGQKPVEKSGYKGKIYPFAQGRWFQRERVPLVAAKARVPEAPKQRAPEAPSHRYIHKRDSQGDFRYGHLAPTPQLGQQAYRHQNSKVSIQPPVGSNGVNTAVVAGPVVVIPQSAVQVNGAGASVQAGGASGGALGGVLPAVSGGSSGLGNNTGLGGGVTKGGLDGASNPSPAPFIARSTRTSAHGPIVRIGDTELHIHITQLSAPTPHAHKLAEIEEHLEAVQSAGLNQLDVLLDDLETHRLEKKPCLKKLTKKIESLKSRFSDSEQQLARIIHPYSYSDDAPTLV